MITKYQTVDIIAIGSVLNVRKSPLQTLMQESTSNLKLRIRQQNYRSSNMKYLGT